MQTIEFHAMNCQMCAMVDSLDPAARAALDAVPAWFEAWEQCFSRFRPDSELMSLNARAGAWTAVSPDLFAALSWADQAREWSAGLASPFLFDTMRQLGYDRSFDQLRGAQNTASAVIPDPAWLIAFNPDGLQVRIPAGARLDLGGVAKGFAAQCAAERLAEYGPALVDAGGDIAVAGGADDDEGWPVEIADPLRADDALDVISLTDGCIATSGRDYRRWRAGDHEMHHLIDPRTGLPTRNSALSATVIAPEMWMAEAAAKVLLIRGAQDGLRWLEEQPELAGHLVLESGAVLRSSAMAHYAQINEPGVWLA